MTELMSFEFVPETARPILEIVTRHLPSRTDFLQQQHESFAALGPGWIQTLLVDPHRTGIPASHVRLRTVEPWAHFVWVLDDDDACADPHLLSRLNPTSGIDLYVFRAFFGEVDDLFPLDGQWRDRELELGYCGAANLILSHDLWMQARVAWDEAYAGDFDFIVAAQALSRRTEWIDVRIASVDQRSYGRA
jgi:hypothetical protein